MSEMQFDELKLGAPGGIHPKDLAIGFTWENIIDRVSDNCETINEQAVRKTIKEMLNESIQNLYGVLEHGNNIQEIIQRAKA